MLTLEEIKSRLHDRNVSLIARTIKVTPVYLHAIKSGKAANPGYEIVKKLSDYLEGNV